jgi:hypothetical protein
LANGVLAPKRHAEASAIGTPDHRTEGFFILSFLAVQDHGPKAQFCVKAEIDSPLLPAHRNGDCDQAFVTFRTFGTQNYFLHRAISLVL